MIVYKATKQSYLNDVLNNSLITKIELEYRKKIKNYIDSGEELSWINSAQNYMSIVLQDNEIPNNCGIAIEYKIPYTSKRIDFIITGRDSKENDVGIIIELKQWSHVQSTGIDGIVETWINKSLQEKPHPSCQVISYRDQIRDYNESVQQDRIELVPCVYAHNYNEKPPVLLSDEYKEYIDQAPVFISGEAVKLRNFIKKYVKSGDNGKILYEIEDGKIRPSKSLQDSILRMVKGNKEFNLLDNQQVVYKNAMKMARLSKKDNKKRCLIVKGGPGTGKTVLAINLLADLTKDDMVCQYVTKNAAPRSVFKAKLHEGIKYHAIDNMFKGSGSYVDSESNAIDVILVDEAHRLNAKSGRFQNMGENQIKEIINASKFSVFFIDESQRVTLKDIGTIDEIKKISHQFGIVGEYQKTLELESQFRCNGSDGYLAWLDDVLEIRKTANQDFDIDYKVEVMDSPIDLKNKIFELNKINNKSRLLAGYCWKWIPEGKKDSNVYDIVIDKDNNGNSIDFKMSWNLNNTETWAIDANSVNEIGCIYTSQGLEFDYVGVIIGNDLRYENGRVISDYNKRAPEELSHKSLKGIRKIEREQGKDVAYKIADEIIKNTYRTLMTRGQKGCYIYCTDKNLSDYLKKRLNQKDEITYSIDDEENGNNMMVAEDSEEYRHE